MSSFSLPSSNQDQLMSLPQGSTSNVPTPESNLDSTGFSIADPFDFSILNKSKLNKKFIFIFALQLVVNLNVFKIFINNIIIFIIYVQIQL